MSGHGNSEEYRDIASANFLQDDEMICPAPTKTFYHVVGKQVKCKKRCDGLSEEECSARVELAKDTPWPEVHIQIWFFQKQSLRNG